MIFDEEEKRPKKIAISRLLAMIIFFISTTYKTPSTKKKEIDP